RDHPACLIFLLDQSDSMRDPLGGDPDRPKHVALADILNGLLYEIVLRSVKSPQEGPRPYFAVAVVGYQTDPQATPIVGTALHPPLDQHDIVWTPDLAKNPLRVERRPAPSGSGEVTTPIWIEPVAGGGTPMCAAFDRAGLIAKSWIDSYPDSFPPIVINITDGESTDGDPQALTQRLQSLRSSDGATLVFNLGLTETVANPVLFASTSANLPSVHAQSLFDMSSELPGFMVDAARSQGFEVQPGARGFGFNADLRAVITFLNVGTAVGRSIR
ncbi:MAG: VWA domain-containing protein, partial [Microthrixaceae bacterium]